jgi:hypothetical protein
LAAAETGMGLMAYRLELAAQGDPTDPANFPGVITRDGLIHSGNSDDADGNAYDLWFGTATDKGIVDYMIDLFSSDIHYADPLLSTPYTEDYATDAHGRSVKILRIEPIQLGSEAAQFQAELVPHPLLGEDYDDPKYDRPPYDGSDPESGIDWDVSAAEPLDSRFVRVKVTGFDGPPGNRIYRSISTDYKLGKTIPYAILSRSRVMIGRNVMIKGNIGSRFMEVDLDNGHPVQMESDFRNLSSDLNVLLDDLVDFLSTNDLDGDNRIAVASSSETNGLSDPEADDIDGDGYINDFDLFLSEFDDNGDGQVTMIEMTDNADDPITGEQLFELMDSFGNSNRDGYNDGFIDANDLYTKIKGEISILATASDWEDGAAGGNYREFLQGSIDSSYNKSPLTLGDPALDTHSYEAGNFNTKSFHDLTVGTIDSQAGTAANDPSQAMVGPDGQANRVEEVPFGAKYPYDYYERPVYTNMVFENVKIPQGTNALFENCRFVGVTFIETETSNGGENYNYAGMWDDSMGTEKHPDKFVTIDGSEVWDTKTIANNIRFDSCTFEGAVVSGDADGYQPTQFAHVRNKVTFTGNTIFNIENAPTLSDELKEKYSRSAILLPHVSVEMGTFVDPYSGGETVELSGTIVAGLIDMRGQVDINGSVITTFEPISGVAPVIGNSSPQFNTTLGYFSSDAGDFEAELPTTGMGKISITYDPTLALPDGINGPIEIVPIASTYEEGGK